LKKNPKLEWFTPAEGATFRLLPPMTQIYMEKHSINQMREEMGFCPICEMEVLAEATKNFTVKRHPSAHPVYTRQGETMSVDVHIRVPQAIDFIPVNIEIAQPTCLSHVWSHYVGFRESYDYCINCDKKREENSNDIETYSYKIHRTTVD